MPLLVRHIRAKISPLGVLILDGCRIPPPSSISSIGWPWSSIGPPASSIARRRSSITRRCLHRASAAVLHRPAAIFYGPPAVLYRPRPFYITRRNGCDSALVRKKRSLDSHPRSKALRAVETAESRTSAKAVEFNRGQSRLQSESALESLRSNVSAQKAPPRPPPTRPAAAPQPPSPAAADGSAPHRGWSTGFF